MPRRLCDTGRKWQCWSPIACRLFGCDHPSETEAERATRLTWQEVAALRRAIEAKGEVRLATRMAVARQNRLKLSLPSRLPNPHGGVKPKIGGD